MPISVPPNGQLTTFEAATVTATGLKTLGVPVGTIYELTVADKYDTTAENYYSDGKPYQYVAKLWNGPEQNLAMVASGLGNGGYANFLKLAEMAFSNETQAKNAILALNGVMPAINTALVFPSK